MTVCFRLYHTLVWSAWCSCDVFVEWLFCTLLNRYEWVHSETSNFIFNFKFFYEVFIKNKKIEGCANANGLHFFFFLTKISSKISNLKKLLVSLRIYLYLFNKVQKSHSKKTSQQRQADQTNVVLRLPLISMYRYIDKPT